MRKRFQIRTPGKVHLAGEHSVLYGHPAILAAIDLATVITIEEPSASDSMIEFDDPRAKVSFKLSNEKLQMTAKEAHGARAYAIENGDLLNWVERFSEGGYELFAKAAIGTVCENLKYRGGMKLSAEGDLPHGRGLGSSAAFAVGLTRAIGKLLGYELSDSNLQSISMRIESLVHGQSSGADTYTCLKGGLVRFEKGKEPVPIEGCPKLSASLIDTGPRAGTTGRWVEKVKRVPEQTRDGHIRELGKIARCVESAIRAGKTDEIALFISQIQERLQSLGVSTDSVNKIVENLNKQSVPAKLSGAGGGGMVLAWGVSIDRDSLGIGDSTVIPVQIGAAGQSARSVS